MNKKASEMPSCALEPTTHPNFTLSSQQGEEDKKNKLFKSNNKYFSIIESVFLAKCHYRFRGPYFQYHTKPLKKYISICYSFKYLQTAKNKASRCNFKLAEFSNKPNIPYLCFKIFIWSCKKSNSKWMKIMNN